jgi:hypothetical protein
VEDLLRPANNQAVSSLGETRNLQPRGFMGGAVNCDQVIVLKRKFA